MAALLAIAVVGAAAGSAQAATLSSWTSYQLTYKSEPGEVNDMTMAWTATHMVLTDAGATIDLEDNYFMRQCTQSADRHSVSCPSVPGANWTSVTLGEEDDRLKVARGDYYAHRVYVDAGAGDDVVDVPLGPDEAYIQNSWDMNRIAGGAGDDVLTGTWVEAGDGNDHIVDSVYGEGEAGDDRVRGDLARGDGGTNYPPGEGDDHVVATYHGIGDDGNDVVIGAGTAARPSKIDGGEGNDTLRAESESTYVTMFGHIGDDDVANIGHGDTYGNTGNDVVTAAWDDAYGGPNDDVVTSVRKRAFGEDGDDVVRVYSGTNRPVAFPTAGGGTTCPTPARTSNETGGGLASGGSGNDFVHGGTGPDSLAGGDGDDRIEANGGDDELDGGSGLDSLDGGPGQDLLTAGPDADSLAAGDGDDLLLGGDGHDTLQGSGGADFLEGGTGGDTLDGGPGSGDAVCYDGRGAPVTVDLRTPGGDGQAGENDSVLPGVEWIGGSQHADQIFLSDGAPATVRSGDGADTIVGGDGNDDLEGGFDDDWVVGGPGNDRVSGGAETVVGRPNSNGNDVVDGGDGNDWVAGDRGNDQLLGGNGDDMVDGRENLFATDAPLNHSPIIPLAAEDALSCGAGIDSYRADYADGIDADCEVGTEGTPRWRQQRVAADGSFELKVRCAWSEATPCTGAATVAPARAGKVASSVNAASAADAPKWCTPVKASRLANVRFSNRAGRVGIVDMRLNRAGRTLLRRRGCLPVRITLAFKGAGQAEQRSSRTLALTAPGFKRKR